MTIAVTGIRGRCPVRATSSIAARTSRMKLVSTPQRCHSHVSSSSGSVRGSRPCSSWKLSVSGGSNSLNGGRRL